MLSYRCLFLFAKSEERGEGVQNVNNIFEFPESAELAESTPSFFNVVRASCLAAALALREHLDIGRKTILAIDCSDVCTTFYM